MSFESATRRKIVQLPTLTRPAGGGVTTIQLPKAGILSKIFLAIRMTDVGIPGAPHALGWAAAIRSVRLSINDGNDICQMSGVGFNYFLRTAMELEQDVVPQSVALTAVAVAAGVNLDMVIPVAVNSRDTAGMIMLQSDQTTVTLSIEWETDAILGGGVAVFSGTATPYLETFSVPASAADLPSFDVIHQILEENSAVAGAGTLTYRWPRGNTYLQVFHGLGMATGAGGGADAFSRYQLRVNQSDFIQDTDVNFLSLQRNMAALSPRRLGVIPVDLMSSAGLGMYDRVRDTINSALVTSLDSVIVATGAGTLFTLRRQLVNLK